MLTVCLGCSVIEILVLFRFEANRVPRLNRICKPKTKHVDNVSGDPLYGLDLDDRGTYSVRLQDGL